MDFSIVIPVRNRPREIVACVAACYAQSHPATRYEVIVVDNGSTDQTAREAARAGARLISEAEPNRCLARNAGARIVRGRWIVFTDSDCIPAPDWLENLAVEIARPPGGPAPGIIAGRIDPAPPRNAVQAYIAARRWIDQEKFLNPAQRLSPRFSPPFASAANLAVRRDVFESVGGFDPALAVAAEDADWCIRAADAGWTIRYAPGAAVLHEHRSDPASMLRQAYDYGIGEAELFAKHRERWGAEEWTERVRYVWAAKGLLRAPLDLIAPRGPAANRNHTRLFGWYDFRANLAHARGRREAGRRLGLRIT